MLLIVIVLAFYAAAITTFGIAMSVGLAYVIPSASSAFSWVELALSAILTVGCWAANHWAENRLFPEEKI